MEHYFSGITHSSPYINTLFIHLKTERQKLQMNKGTPEMTLYCKISWQCYLASLLSKRKEFELQ